MIPRLRLDAHEIHATCDPESLGFTSTEELEPDREVLGQEEAMDALAFGIAIDSPGFNLFVLGRPGSGRHTFVRQALEARSRELEPPADWCYVSDFHDPRRPRILEIPTGRGPRLRDDMETLTADLRESIPRILESEDVASRRSTVAEEHAIQASALMEAFRREVEADGYVAVVGEGDSMMIVPARGGEPLTRKAYEDLAPEVRQEVEAHHREATKRLMAVQRDIHEIQRDAHAQVSELHQEVIERLVRSRIEHLRRSWGEVDAVQRFLVEVAEDVVKHVPRFTHPQQLEGDPAQIQTILGASQEDFLRRYHVNPVVTSREDRGAPVVEETNPTLRNLLGRMEGQVRFGVMVTDFTRIAPGALHRAQGGFLVLDAEELLTRPLAWPSLKRVLRTGELRPADPAAEVGLLVTESLEPEAIPARVKVVLVGRPRTYYVLQAMDPDFSELFKVKVDFARDMERSPANERRFGNFVARTCRSEGLLPFEAPAVARVVEEASRLAGDQRKLTTRLRSVVDLLREASHGARAGGSARVSADHVGTAVRRRVHRDTRPHREILELLERGVLAFHPQGTEVGQLHGIGLLALNDHAFGRPMKVMASAYAGTRGIVAIEREASLSGPIHSKGVLILQGYLGRRFARQAPLVLSASLSFDQLYEEVEGDSASVAELYALMSAIGGVPLRQDLAVTGALNQEGLVLPVGGVTQKVEGFYDACRVVGLTGTQGVILPRRNVENLVLREDVREAVERETFHLWALDRVEEGWEILAGRDAGRADGTGAYTPGSVHAAVAGQLATWRETWDRRTRQDDRPGAGDGRRGEPPPPPHGKAPGDPPHEPGEELPTPPEPPGEGAPPGPRAGNEGAG